MNRTVLLLACLLLLSVCAISQEEQKQKAITLNGYVSSIQSVMFDSLTGSATCDNILHNRLNLKGYLNEKASFTAEFRNRFFFGDLAGIGKAYAEMTSVDPGWMDLSWNLLNENSFFLNTSVDRLTFDYKQGNFEVHTGRQRINWGQAFLWNVNDIFNTYSFFDFDYPERPGSDAIRLQYFPTYSSTFEVAAKLDHENDLTVAGLWRFNKWNYDIQFLAGYVNGSDLVAGSGWSGSIGSVSFRGEASLFVPIDDSTSRMATALVTAGIDKILKDHSAFQLQLMYSNRPLDLEDLSRLYEGNLSAKDLAFSKFSAFGQFTWAATPLLNIGLSAMWFPDADGYYAGPSIDYSLNENLDITIVWQHFDARLNHVTTRLNLGFLRLKYAF